MKKAILVAVLFIAVVPSQSFGQSAVKSRDLGGTWHLVFDIDREADSAMERIILNAVDGFLDEIDIYMEFQSDYVLKVSVDSFGEEDVDYSSWEIGPDGGLRLGDTEKFRSDDDTVWMWKGSDLAAYEYDERGHLKEKDHIYLERID